MDASLSKRKRGNGNGKTEKEGKALRVKGNSIIEYDERVLHLSHEGKVDKTLRLYRNIEFQRRVGEQQQESTIRPAVRRMILLRLNQAEVPFSQDGPMTWEELVATTTTPIWRAIVERFRQ